MPIGLLILTLLTSGIITSPLLWLLMAGLLGLGAWQAMQSCSDGSPSAHLHILGPLKALGLMLQVQQHGLWPTLQQLIRGLQGAPQQQHPERPAERQARRRAQQQQQGGRQTQAQRKQRFEEVARAVQALWRTAWRASC